MYPLERGIGYGNIRLSLLFRPIEAKLSPNLLGFDIGTLHVHSMRVVDVAPDMKDALSSCKLKIGTPSSDVKISSGEVEGQEDETVEWEPDQPLLLPLERRYSSAMVVKFIPTGITTTSTKGIAVLWLRDLIDNDEHTIRIGIWGTKNSERIEQNYMSRDGHEDTAGLPNNENEEERVRIGTLEIDAVFKPGLTEEHSKTRHSGDPRTREEEEALERMDSGGMRDDVGDGKPIADIESIKSGEDNTSVYPNDTEYVGQQNGASDTAEDSDAPDDNDNDDDDEDNKSIIGKYKKWRASEHSLHAVHRGVMQRKPARTTKWIKDSVKKEGHSIANRFRMTQREPDVETEI